MQRQRIRKCGYARVSTLAEEQENSLVTQTETYKRMIKSDDGAIFVGIYADKKSGKNIRRRPQFNEMVKAVRRGEIDYIITKSIARFARNLVETLKIVREFRERGVGIYFEKENIDTLKTSNDFILSIYSLVAESELTSMGDNVRWAARRRYANGSVELNSNIYGYTLKDGKLVVVPEEAEIVREVFARYLSGEGTDKIAKTLSDRGVRRKVSDSRWRHSTIANMLRNEKYIGDALLQKAIYIGGKKTINDGSVPQYYVENNHEPIISREDFIKAQQLLQRRAAVYARYNKYDCSPFSGKIICKHCGKSYLHRKNNRGTPYEKWIWSCTTYIQQGRRHCCGYNIREKDLIEHFLFAYNEASNFVPDGAVRNLGESIKDLLGQERELIALRAKGYITREAYEQQHGELLWQIKEYEAEYTIESRRTGGVKYKNATDYNEGLVANLECAEIQGYEITFRFKNGAVITRTFNNNTNRRETWAKKMGGKR